MASKNATFVTGMVQVWHEGITNQQLRPGSLGAGPAALLLRHHKELGYDPVLDLLTEWHSTAIHPDASTWWNYALAHGLSRREGLPVNRYYRELPGLLTNLPWPVWLLYELDRSFDLSGYQHKTQDEDAMEVVFEPHLTVQRLENMLYVLLDAYPVSVSTHKTLVQQLRTAAA